MKGSKAAIANLVSSDDFVNIINNQLKTIDSHISSSDFWMPNETTPTKEVGLSVFLRENFDSKLSSDSIKWWLYKGFGMPKWDLISTCTINGARGILLVEAKAHRSELNKNGKKARIESTEDSKENHRQIGEVIKIANSLIQRDVGDINTSRDSCYQFSNRVAHAWWLATQGIRVLLMYLGFLNNNDLGIKYKILANQKDWEDCFLNHIKIVSAESLLNSTVNCGKGSFITICRSL